MEERLSGCDVMQGKISVDELKRLVTAGEIETVIAVFPDMYGRLVGKRFVAQYFLDDVAEHGMHACDYLLACDMEMDPVPGYAFTSWAKGYGDFNPIPDFETLRVASWQTRSALVLCDISAPIAPRTMLRKQVERAERLGFLPMAASELELYVFKDSYESAAEKGYIRLEPIGRVIEDYHVLQGTKEEFLIGAIRSHLERSGVPVESSKGEWGPGQQDMRSRSWRSGTNATRARAATSTCRCGMRSGSARCSKGSRRSFATSSADG